MTVLGQNAVKACLLAAALGCGESAPPQESRAPASPAGGAPPLRFRRAAVVDREGIGSEAFSLLVPADWEMEGAVHLRLDNPAFPAYGTARVRNPRGTEEFEIFPNLPFFWSGDPMTFSTHPPGTKYFGNVVRQPLGAERALREIVLPTFRAGAGDLRVVDARPAPDLAETVRRMQAQAQPEARIEADAARLRVEYARAGRTLEEEIYGVVQVFNIPIQTFRGPVVHQNWWLDYLFSFKAQKGKLDAAAPLLQTVARSFRLDRDWYNRYAQLVEMFIRHQIRQIRQIGEISRMVAQTSREISEDRLRQWERIQTVRDRMNEEFSRHIRGVDAYQDPNRGGPVELPAGYGHAWSNKLGEYLVTDRADFNPNVGSNVEWTRLEPRR